MTFKKKKVFKILLLTILSLVVLATVSILILLYSMFSSLEDISSPSKAEIKNITGLNFSDNVKIIGSQYISALDSCLYIALDIPTEELKRIFLEDKFKPSTTIRFLTNGNVREREWFKPDSISNFKSFSYTDDVNNIGMYGLYENSTVQIKRMYIFWFVF